MSSQNASGKSFAFGPFALLPAARLLLRSGKPLKVGSRAFDILSVLCQHAGEVVSKENLIDSVWNGVVVEETNLRVHIAALRRVMGDGRGAQRYLVSVPLRGYSLVAPVTTDGGTQVAAAAAPVASASGGSSLARKPDRLDSTVTAGSVVHIIDDDESVRNALDTLFRSVDIVTRLYRTPSDFLQAPREDGPSCLVLDVRLPGISGLDFQKLLTDMKIRIPVVFMTGFGDIPMCAQGMRAGAVDFLAKPFRHQDMLDAVARALESDRVARSQQQDTQGLLARMATLSARERQVMVMVTAGQINKQVAAALDLSEITVKIHRGHVMRKMGAKSLADLVRMASALQLAAEPH